MYKGTSNKHRQIQKRSHKIEHISLKEDQINISVSKLLTTVAENHKEPKNTGHCKLKEYAMQNNSTQKNIRKLFHIFTQ